MALSPVAGDSYFVVYSDMLGNPVDEPEPHIGFYRDATDALLAGGSYVAAYASAALREHVEDDAPYCLTRSPRAVFQPVRFPPAGFSGTVPLS